MTEQLCIILCSLTLGLAVVTDVKAAGNVKELTQVYDSANKAAQAGDVDKMLGLKTTELRKEITAQLKKKSDREDFVMMGKIMIPESYEVQHVAWNKNGTDATMYLLARFAAMEMIQRPAMQQEIMVKFRKEKPGWRMGVVTPLGEYDKVKRVSDLSYNPDDANTDSESEIGGRIVRTEFKKDHTLVILRVMDEECAVFLPSKEVLEKAGMNFDELKPWNLHSFTGFFHKTDKMKFFANGGNLIEE